MIVNLWNLPFTQTNHSHYMNFNLYLYEIDNKTLQVLSKVKICEIVGIGGEDADVNRCCNIQIILKMFWQSFCTLSLDIYDILNIMRSIHVSNFTSLFQIQRYAQTYKIVPETSKYQTVLWKYCFWPIRIFF